MKNLEKDLENRIINYQKLLEYGFITKNNQYIFKTKLHNEHFEMIVTISDDMKISKIIDLESNDEYILVDINDSVGKFVGALKEEYYEKLKEIINTCTTPDVFKHTQTKEIIRYIQQKYNDSLEFLWKKFSNNAIWRNKENNNWYALLLIIPERKLNINSDNIVEIINIRYQQDKITDIVDNNTIFPGYHMNKKGWITIKLDYSVDTQTITNLIDNSYNLSLKK